MAPHNLWLRCASRGEAGQYLKCVVLYGHHFEVDGKADPSRTRLWLHAPGEERRALDLEEGDDGLVSGFTCTHPGLYALTAEYDLGIYSRLRDGTYAKGKTGSDDAVGIVHFVHCAKTLVSVGEIQTLPGSYGMRLEIVPLRIDRGEIEMLVQSAGRPVPNCEVYAHCRGRRTSRFARTDRDGTVSFGLFPGEWMFIVRREAPDEGEADVRVTGATLALTVDEREPEQSRGRTAR